MEFQSFIHEKVIFCLFGFLTQFCPFKFYVVNVSLILENLLN